jgi:hypothetical protein
MQSLALRRRLADEKFMKVMDHFERAGNRGFYRPIAQVSFEQAVDMVADAISTAKELGLSELLVNTTALTGFGPPSVFARYAMATRWAQSSGAAMRVAMVARPEIIDRQKIGVLMVQNRGAAADVFTSEMDALQWLDAGLAPGQRRMETRNRPQTED